MKIQTFIFTLAFVVACGCATQRFAKDNGDVGQYILQQAIRYGGSPTNTDGLPVVTGRWCYMEDARGMQIQLPADMYSEVELFLNQAFAGARQFGPADSADTRARIHEYRISAKGGGGV
jgi:hypothetical protein